MSRKTKARRSSRGALLFICLLFLASGALRLADGTGDALARGVEGLAGGDAISHDTTSAQSCSTDSGALLAAIRAKGVELDERERALDHRAQSLKLAEDEIHRNLAALEQAEGALEATIALADGAAENDIDRLTQVYQKMKPKEAAELFQKMDPRFSSGFLARMKPDSAAAILAGLDPEMAYTLSIILAGRNSGVPTQ